MKLIFTDQGVFAAKNAAEKWCRDNGISYGSSCACSPIGLMRGDINISKWHNLSRREIAFLDGRMTGEMRNGPVTIELRDEPSDVK